MLDIETTGVNHKTDDVLQIALLELNFNGDYWERGRHFNFFQHTDRQPESPFAKKCMPGLFERCRNTDPTPVNEARQQILDFTKDCGAASPNVYICGWHVGVFDLSFLSQHGYLRVAQYNSEGVLEGDCHYRTYEISGALQLVANLAKVSDLNSLVRRSLEGSQLPEGQRHDALYDCERQLCIMNGLLKIARGDL